MDDNGTRQAMLGPTSAHAAGEDFTDARGRRWIVVGKVVPKEIDVAETEKERRNARDYPRRIVKDVFRNTKRYFADQAMEIAYGLHNFRTILRDNALE